MENTADIKSYTPISLLSKVFPNFYLLQKSSTKDDSYAGLPPITRASGFRVGYSTLDHLQVVKQLQENAKEYNMSLCFIFVGDYGKAFDSM